MVEIFYFNNIWNKEVFILLQYQCTLRSLIQVSKVENKCEEMIKNYRLIN